MKNKRPKMVMYTFNVKVEKPEDIAQISELTKPMLGETCSRVRFICGGELIVDIGQLIPYISKDTTAPRRGEWSLGICGMGWQLLDEEGLFTLATSNECQKMALTRLETLVSAKVVAFEVDYPGLGVMLRFDNNQSLKLTRFDDQEGSRLIYWDLLTPTRSFIQAGPGSQWLYQRFEAIEPDPLF
ncbi:MAG: hypothetical protein JNJ78_07385 [Anaerolineae bacterium]|nr:hypothetical protein [Anaerolineae bacterium]